QLGRHRRQSGFLGWRLEKVVEDLPCRLAVKPCYFAGEHLQDGQAPAPHVGLACERTTGCLFRRAVGRRHPGATYQVALSTRRKLKIRQLASPGQAKVGDFCLTAWGQQHVSRLDVLMDDTLLVNGV